jgi:hypothetical protein
MDVAHRDQALLPAAAAVISIGASGIWFRLILADVIDPEKTRVSPA